jgi:ABC-type oligopeptide transport system substrate-binding subunit
VSGSPENAVGISSPQVDEAIVAANAESNARMRSEQYAVAAHAVLDQVAVLPVAQLEHRVAVSARVRSLALDRFGIFDPLAVRVVSEGSGGDGG